MHLFDETCREDKLFAFEQMDKHVEHPDKSLACRWPAHKIHLYGVG